MERSKNWEEFDDILRGSGSEAHKRWIPKASSIVDLTTENAVVVWMKRERIVKVEDQEEDLWVEDLTGSDESDKV